MKSLKDRDCTTSLTTCFSAWHREKFFFISALKHSFQFVSIVSIHALPWRVCCHLLIDTGRLLFRSFERCVFSRPNKFPQPVPPGKVLQRFDPLGSPLLNLLQYISGFLVLRSPKLYTVFYMWSNEHQVKRDYYIPGCASAETTQDAVGLPCCQAGCWLTPSWLPTMTPKSSSTEVPLS